MRSAAGSSWLAGAVLQAEPGKLQQLLQGGDPEPAGRLLAEELGRNRHLGALVTLRGGVPFPN